MVTESIPLKTGRKRKKDPSMKWINMIEKNLSSTSRPGRTHIFGSNAGLCERQTTAMMYMDPTFSSYRSAPSQFYFAVGNAFEDTMFRAFNKGGVLIDDEVEVRVKPNDDESLVEVSGRIDFVLMDHEWETGDRQYLLVELKSCGNLPDKPRHSHKAQILTYMVLTGMPKALLWYVSRHVVDYDYSRPHQRLKQRIFKIEPSYEERLQTARTICRGALYAKYAVLPPLPDHMKKYKCGFCPFQSSCWDSEKAPITIKPATIKTAMKINLEAENMAIGIMSKQDAYQVAFEKRMAETKKD